MYMQKLKFVIGNILAQGLGTITTLVFTIVCTRLLTVDEYGELRYMMILLPLLMTISLPGYDSVILRNANLRINASLLQVFRVRILAGSVGSILVLIALFLFHRKISEALTFFLVATIVLLPWFETATSYRNYLLGCGLQRVGINLLLQTRLCGFVLLIFFISLIYYMDISMLWVYPAWMVSSILPTITTFCRIVFRRYVKGVSMCGHKGGKSYVVEAITITIASLVYTLVFSIDKFLVRYELGVKQLALYSLLVMVPQELSRLFDSALPIFYRQLFFDCKNPDVGKNKHKLVHVLLCILLVMCVYTAGFYILSSFVFGKVYKYSFGMVLLSSFLIPSISMEYFYNHKIFVNYGAKGVFSYSICSLCVVALVTSVGLLLGGIIGIIISLTVKQFIFPYVFMFYYKHTKK